MQQDEERKPVRDLKYRCLIEGISDDPKSLAAAILIDFICLREQGASIEEASKIVSEKEKTKCSN